MNISKKHLIILALTVVILTGIVIAVQLAQKPAAKPEVPFSPQENSSYTVAERPDSDYLAVIKETYKNIQLPEITIRNKELIRPHWYIITTAEGEGKLPFRYIFYDDRPNSDALVISAPGTTHANLPAANTIPDDVLKQIEIKSR